MNDQTERIRELHAAGMSERQVAATLRVTRHQVRRAIADYSPMPTLGATWVETCSLALDHARHRPSDPSQLELAELAYDIAEFLDGHGHDVAPFGVLEGDARRLAGSLNHVIEGVRDGSNPLVAIHVKRAKRFMSEIEARA